MRPSRREFLKWVSASGIALSLSRLGPAEAAASRRALSLPGRGGWNPAANGAGRIDGVAKVTGAKLYASDFRAVRSAGLAANDLARDAHSRARCHACLCRNGSRPPERRAQAVGGGDRGRSRQDRHPRSRILYRRPVLSGRQDADLYGAAGRAADLRDVRRLRSGAPGACATERSSNSARRPAPSRCQTTAPIASRGWPAQRPMRPTSIRRSWRAGSARDAPRTRRFRCGRRPAKDTQAAYAKAAIYGEQIRAELAAKNPNLLVLDREFDTQSVDPMFLEPESGLAWYNGKSRKPRTRAWRAVSLRGGGIDRASARRGPRSFQAGAHQHPVHLCRRRLRRPRPHAVRALRGAGGDVLPRPAGPAGA